MGACNADMPSLSSGKDSEPSDPMTNPVSRLGISVPIGGWHPLLPAMLRSLALQNPRPQIAILNASGDPRVTRALDASGLAFTYRRDGPDAGQSAAIVEGWRNTESEYVGWLNVDDILMPGAVEEAGLAFSANPEAAAVFAGSVILDAQWDVTGLHSQVRNVTAHIRRSNPISQPSCFMRRSAVEAVGGLDANLHYVMDWDLWVRLFESGGLLEPVDTIWSAVFWGEGTKTSGMPPRRAREIFQLTRPRVGLFNASKTVASMYLDGGFTHWLFAYSSAGRRGGASDGVRLTAARHPGEEPQPAASLRIPNVFASPRTELEVAVDGEAAAVTAQEASVDETAPGRWRLTFAEPVAPGGDRWIRLTTKGAGCARFLSASWRR